MTATIRAAAAALLAAGPVAAAAAATPAEIGTAVKTGAEFLKHHYRNGVPGGGKQDGGHGIGPAALAGLALLEAGAPADDPAVRAITRAVRDAAVTETHTYQISLCLLFLDRLGDPADGPRIQLLGVRLLAGQNAQGGWAYVCVPDVSAADERMLRAGLDGRQLTAGRGPTDPTRPAAGGPAAGKAAVEGTLHADVERYRKGLLASAHTPAPRGGRDDNSNTQFGILGVWVARRHAVPVEAALERIERRFLATQDAQTGGWPYHGSGGEGSPAMTCAGLIGLATAVGRREERVLASDPAAKVPPAMAAPGREAAPQDRAIRRALEHLGGALKGHPAAAPAKGKDKEVNLFDGNLGGKDLYFLWSLERVGMIYGTDRIAGVDWYALGAGRLIPAQNRDGSWGGRGTYGPEVDTSFALLFLARANPANDLTSKVRGRFGGTELRSTTAPDFPGTRPAASPPPAVTPSPAAPPVGLPPVAARPPAPVAPATPAARPAAVDADAASGLADELARAPAAGWEPLLERVRDGKGPEFTRALVAAIPRLDGERKRSAREALAERLSRMAADTLRGMMTGPDAELRRGAVLAAAMRDDKDHVPDLIARLADDEELVVRAARAGLRSLAGGRADLGPEPNSTAAQRRAAAAAWRAWWAARPN
ncbi:MAG TPA: HEAT repeat domain-containing protein [Urbifossiella sp.]|nr:HEAT repeat domain-containing protein [Urbifossiella sp.]